MSGAALCGPILLIGDSITFAWRPFYGRPELVNRGTPGVTTAQMRENLDILLAERAFTGVHILGGVNDFAGHSGSLPASTTRANLRAMCEAARAATERVWLGSILPVGSYWPNPDVPDPNAYIVALNRALRADAEAAGATYLDYHRLLVSADGLLRGDMSVDMVHLSDAGYEAITALALGALSQG